MKKYALALCFIFILAFAIGCAQTQQQSTAAPKTEANAGVKQTTQSAAYPSKQEIPAEVSELLSRHKTKITSLYYKYKGPESGEEFYDFYVKSSRIKYNPYLEIKTLDAPDSYDTIFIDKTARTAQSYCVAAYCKYKGKKEDLSYDNAYISTPLDWINGLTTAKKVGEEVIDSRSAWKIETNKGILWVDTFYGIPLKAESGGKTYRFQQISVNSVQDSDVVPS